MPGRSGWKTMATGNGTSLLSARELALAAMTTAQDLTGFTPEATTRLEWDDECECWCVDVDVLELARIPNTTDVLGRYETRLARDGTLRGSRRTVRYRRA